MLKSHFVLICQWRGLLLASCRDCVRSTFEDRWQLFMEKVKQARREVSPREQSPRQQFGPGRVELPDNLTSRWPRYIVDVSSHYIHDATHL